MTREYGWAPIGQRVFLPCKGRKFKRVNIIAGLLNNKLICPTQYSWNTDATWFNEWFENLLCPSLEPNSVIIMDNASFHRKNALNTIATLNGHRILWLPPYSPDKNPIENKWATIKNWLRLHSKNYVTIQDAISASFRTY